MAKKEVVAKELSNEEIAAENEDLKKQLANQKKHSADLRKQLKDQEVKPSGPVKSHDFS